MDYSIKELKQYVHFHGAPVRGKILMVVSSPGKSKQTGWPIGFWGAELTHPMLVFQEAGFEVVLASTEGGEVIMDAYSNPLDQSGYSAHDIITLGYINQEGFTSMLKNTVGIKYIDDTQFDAIFLVGGQGPMYTFRKNALLEKLFVGFYESGKPSAAVCHATALLLDATTADGKLLVEHKTWTGFANAEEDFADNAVGMQIQPYRIETEARKLENTNFKVADPFSAFAILDGKLVTGQQHNSGGLVAKLVVELLS